MNYILKNNLNVESNYTKTANSILINSPLIRDARFKRVGSKRLFKNHLL
ncbi:hypothetical protein HpRN161_03460 [Helicobacter pylori]